MTTGTRTTYEVRIEDVEYLRHGDKPFLARLFKPQGSGPFPIMVELHGGAWVNGNRENGNVANEALAGNGIIVAALDFAFRRKRHIPPLLQTSTTESAGVKPTPETGTAFRKISAQWAPPAVPTRPMLLGMRPHDLRYAALSLTNGATDVDGSASCVIMVSPVIDPLGRYHYAKGLRDDVKPPESVGERTVAMHDMYWVTEEAMAEGAPARILAGGERTELPPTYVWRATTRQRTRARTWMSSSGSIARPAVRLT